ncbi:shikimate dehydrogenase [Faucicola boevrei]|uniref:shikimate dehydrogenase n=1 Tax=Faucicola boevrei TaxID=346665 RepID=UPI000365C0D2|nr:shikimate dehydrogenase [Moraxella boevrei]
MQNPPKLDTLNQHTWQFATPNSQHFIVIGNPITHSKSPELHQKFAQKIGITIQYQRQFCPNDWESFIAVVSAFFHGGGHGANVTVPFKEMAFELCQMVGELSDVAKVAGAVNTLAIKDGKLFGDNTDGRGLVADLISQGIDLTDKKILILGAGGATRGAILPLLNANIQRLHIANRTLEKAENLVKLFNNPKITVSNLTDISGHFDVIINATSIGLSGETLPFSDDLTADFAYDMMYGKPSAFLDFFAQKNAKMSNGLGMLIHQGALAFEIWVGKKVDLVGFAFG